jgi:hypothetical protein
MSIEVYSVRGKIHELCAYSIDEMQADNEKYSTFWSRLSWKIRSKIHLICFKVALMKYPIKNFFKTKKQKAAEIKRIEKRYPKLRTRNNNKKELLTEEFKNMFT